MNTADLIAHLASDTQAVTAHKTRRDMAGGIIAGAIVTLGATALAFGVQANLGHLDRLLPLLMKLAFVSALGVPAFAVADQLARPGLRGDRLAPFLMVPVMMLGALAILQFLLAPPAIWSGLILGSSWSDCPVRIVVLSLPILAGLTIALRKQAPVHLRHAGAMAGLMAGAMAAAIYAVACTEASAAFVLLWYSCGIAATTAIGALLGPLTLRW